MKAVETARMMPIFLLRVAKPISAAMLIAAAFFLALYAIGQAIPLVARAFGLAQFDTGLIWGLAYVSFAIAAFSDVALGFLHQKLWRQGKEISGPAAGSDNLAEFMDFEAAQLYWKTMRRMKLPFEKLLFYRIVNSSRLSFAFRRLAVSKADLSLRILAQMKERAEAYESGKASLGEKDNLASQESVLKKAAALAAELGERKISIFILFLVLAEENSDFQKMLDSLGLQKEDVASVMLWQMRLESYRGFRNKFWEMDNLRLALPASPALALIGGYTVALDRFSRDITLYNPLRQGGVVLYGQEIKLLEETLSKRAGECALIVGEPGSGRRSLVYNLANKIVQEQTDSSLRHMRILELDMLALIGSAPGKSVLAATLKQIFSEAVRAKNVILVIPQIHNYVGQHFGAESVAEIDISSVLGSFVSMPGFRLVGITTYDGLHRSIERNREVAARFSKIELAAVAPKDTLRVLKEEALRREKASRIYIPIITLKEIVKLCDYFIADIGFPGKAINLLDDLLANKSGGGRNKAIMPEDVDAFFSHKYEVPAGAAAQKEKELLLNLESIIHEGLVNQKEAVSELANAMRRARADIKRQKKTIGNFLFLGPTGCGKTETAKQLARSYFGSEKKIIRLDMAEYQLVESIDKLAGTLEAPGYLATAVRENPFSLVLIDEIEKAHPGILNIFLNIFDEGEMTDGSGRKVDFKHTIMIATSNAGAERIKIAVEAGKPMSLLKNKLIDELLANGTFKPEFINRFDGIVLYRPLDRAESAQVAMLMLKEVQAGLRQKRIEFDISLQLAQELAAIGFDPVFGGRAMRRAMQDKIENPIARSLLSGGLNPGDTFKINPASWQVETGGTSG